MPSGPRPPGSQSQLAVEESMPGRGSRVNEQAGGRTLTQRPVSPPRPPSVLFGTGLWEQEWAPRPRGPHLNNATENVGTLINKTVLGLGRSSVQEAVRPATGIGIGAGRGGEGGSPALVRSLVPRTGGGCQEAGEAQGQCLEERGTGAGPQQLSTYPLTAPASMEEPEVKIGSILGA